VELADFGPGTFVDVTFGEPVAETALAHFAFAHPARAPHEHEVQRLEEFAMGVETRSRLLSEMPVTSMSAWMTLMQSKPSQTGWAAL